MSKVVTSYANIIDKGTYGRELRVPIRNALDYLYNNAPISEDYTKILLTQANYDDIAVYDSKTVYCISKEEVQNGNV